jgi:multidrug resistance efflux pump
MSKIFRGFVKARIVEARFALSGKVAGVQKVTGDTVKKWDVIASLDRKILQMELDRELAGYEKVRADFEVYAQKNSEPQNDLDKYLKTEKQAMLNVSVKDVELAKAKLDMTNLLSPVDGIIMDDSGIVPGLFTTPAGSGVKIIDTSSYYFEVEVEQKDIPYFSESKSAEVHIEPKVVSGGHTAKVGGKIGQIFSDGKKFLLKIPISDPSILIGMKGEVEF